MYGRLINSRGRNYACFCVFGIDINNLAVKSSLPSDHRGRRGSPHPSNRAIEICQSANSVCVVYVPPLDFSRVHRVHRVQRETSKRIKVALPKGLPIRIDAAESWREKEKERGRKRGRGRCNRSRSTIFGECFYAYIVYIRYVNVRTNCRQNRRGGNAFLHPYDTRTRIIKSKNGVLKHRA